MGVDTRGKPQRGKRKRPRSDDSAVRNAQSTSTRKDVPRFTGRAESLSRIMRRPVDSGTRCPRQHATAGPARRPDGARSHTGPGRAVRHVPARRPRRARHQDREPESPRSVPAEPAVSRARRRDARPHRPDDVSVSALNRLRGKYGVTLEPEAAAARARCSPTCFASADIVVENFSAGHARPAGRRLRRSAGR